MVKTQTEKGQSMKKNNLRLGVIAAVALAFVLPQSVVHADDTQIGRAHV